MATTTIPRPESRWRWRWVVIGIVLTVLAIIVFLALRGVQRRGSAAAPPTVAVTRGSVVASVAGSGAVAAAQSLDLPFQASGNVTQVLVKEGDTVAAGQPLARIDDRDLQLQVADAQAGLQSAQARLEQAQKGNATPEDLAASQASLNSAQAQLQKARTGNVTAADIASASAQLRAAQAKLDALKDPTPDKLSAAQLKLTQAQTNLQKTRDNDSAAKTRAEQDLLKAADALTQAQASYASAKSNWDYVQETGNDPANPTRVNSQGKSVPNKLNDTQRQQYYQTYVQAEASMHSAEKSVASAQITYDNARQQEVSDVQSAEAQVADAQQQIDALRNPGPTDLAQAQASVDQARAELQKLRQGGTRADVAAAQANVDQAKANLDKLSAPGSATDLSIQQAGVAQAEQALKQAQLKLENATLKAPFAGIVTSVSIVPGSIVNAGSAVLTLVDRSTLHVDLKLSENDVAKVDLGQPVALTIDSISGWSAQGKVAYVAPAAETKNDVVTYKVQVSFPDADPRVKVGMTANLSITTGRKDNVLLVPNTALLPKGSGRSVQVPGPDGQPREVDVQTGLTDGSQTEIINGLKQGDQVIANPNAARTPNSGGLFGR